MTKLRGWKLSTVVALCAATAIVVHGQTFTTLHSFNGADGQYPSGVVQAADGNFYGITNLGGANMCNGVGCGTVFEITPTGVLTTLYNFCSQDACLDGNGPEAELIQATDGNFYGTTAYGGANTCDNFGTLGCGTVFRLSPSGMLTTLYDFCLQGSCPDGLYPQASLIQAVGGNFYGATFFGGNHNACNTGDGFGCGTVFKISPSGALTTLYSFCPQTVCTDGSGPSGLIQATDGSFYGTTVAGGANNQGTVFKITSQGALTTLYSFCSQTSCTDGRSPIGLIQTTDGNFYGTTFYGGVAKCGVNGSGCGTVFKITPGGTLTTMYAFNNSDSGPVGLIEASDGNLYGITSRGRWGGTIFTITRGRFATLYTFCFKNGCTDGEIPAGLVQGTDGDFYGATTLGGANGDGTVFRLTTGLGPFVSLVRNPAKAGQVFGILGQGFFGTTSVSLNGTAATFSVKSATLVEATVPAGATTGFVTVTTPSGTLTSNVPFHVIK